MKDLKSYLNEGLLSRKISTKTPIRYTPNEKVELVDAILELLNKGITDLNCIDVSNIDDMGDLFYIIHDTYQVHVGNVDVSQWNVSNVKFMSGMFYGCDEFNCDLSNWDVSNVQFLSDTFHGCSSFNSDLSKWDVSKVRNLEYMFADCEKFNSDLSKWDVSNVQWFTGMFRGCKEFNADLSKWKVRPNIKTKYMFDECTTLEKNNKIPAWYK